MKSLSGKDYICIQESQISDLLMAINFQNKSFIESYYFTREIVNSGVRLYFIKKIEIKKFIKVQKM